MQEVPDLVEPVETEQSAGDLRLLIAEEPWSRTFVQNLGDFFQRSGQRSEFDAAPLESVPADFWPDVFVDRRLPWRRFFQSGIYHVLALIAIWQGSRLLALQPHVISQPRFSHADVVYYSPSEYLPPLDTGSPASARARKADPEYSAQPIISVPPQASNHSQTIVTPPKVKLGHDVALPNLVALIEKAPDPLMPIGPAPVLAASEKSRPAPPMERSVIAPPPVVQAVTRESLSAPQTAVVAPPPDVNSASTRRLGDLNIGNSSVISPAPQLSLDEQRALAGRSSPSLNRRTAQVIAPPPALSASAGSRSGGGMLALSLHPAVGAPPAPPAGNRRGTFAATPEGHRGATGSPGPSTGANDGARAGIGKTGSSSGKSASGSVPSGLYVGKTSAAGSPVAGDASNNTNALSVNPRLIANAHPPALTRTMQPETQSKLSEEERAVFGGRKFYSLSLNMPNLNSAGGSWIIRFAALKPDSTSSYSRVAASNDASGSASSGDLSAPSATRKVDPAYPLELMRQNVSGTVILYAVIHADGTVGGVRVLRSVDERLDQFASQAIGKWQFQPATKNGSPVDVEATFWIPFRPTRVGSNY